MFNIHRGKHQQQTSSAPQRRRLTPEEQAKMRENELMAQEILITYLEVSEMNKRLNKQCFNRCLNIEERIMDDNEKECLKNCAGKMESFMKKAKEVMQEWDPSYQEREALYKKSVAFMKGEKFMK